MTEWCLAKLTTEQIQDIMEQVLHVPVETIDSIGTEKYTEIVRNFADDLAMKVDAEWHDMLLNAINKAGFAHQEQQKDGEVQ